MISTKRTSPENIARRIIHLLLEVLSTIQRGRQEGSTQQQQHEASLMSQALARVIQSLGPGNLMDATPQDFVSLPTEVLHAIEMYLDNERLSAAGKIFGIAQVLLGLRHSSH